MQPELIEVFDLGFQYHANDSLDLKLDIYRNRISHSIVIAYPSIRSENHPNDAVIFGGEFGLRQKLSRDVTWYFNWAYQNNEQTGNETDSAGNVIEFTYAPKHKINLGGSWQFSEHLQTTIDVNWKDKYYAPSFWYPIVFGDPTVFALDDFTYVHFATSWDLPFADIDGERNLTLRISGRNLLDETPFETLTGFGGRVVGREFYASVSLKFD